MRMSKEAFAKLIEKVLPFWKRRIENSSHTGGKIKVPLRDALTFTLWYLASKTTFRELGNLFGYHRGAINRKFHETVELFCESLTDLIQWPTDFETVEAKFRSLVGFPGVVGAIDGTHVKVLAPAEEQASYNSRKQVHSIGTIAVVDHQMRFIYAVVGIPGSLHDQWGLNNCSLGQALRLCPNAYFSSRNYHLIGDSAFSLQLNMMTPYRDFGNLTHRQSRYNRKHSQTRQLVENAFCLLKSKFRSLQMLEVDLKRAPKIVEACMLLHNFILNDVFGEQQLQQIPQHEPVIIGDRTATAKRENISALL